MGKQAHGLWQKKPELTRMRVPCVVTGIILENPGENRKISGCPLGLPIPNLSLHF